MPKRADIAADEKGFRRLSYTCRAGWIDWVHAGTMARPLKAQVVDRIETQPFNVTLEGRAARAVQFGMAQGPRPVSYFSRSTQQYVFFDHISYPEREAAALGMFLHTSAQFERLQGSFPWVLSSRSRESSFSGEDLMSNVVGFFAVMRGYTQGRMRIELGELGVNECYRIWDAQFGRDGKFDTRNSTVTPVQYDVASLGISCEATSRPPMFDTIVPAEHGTTWVAVRTPLTANDLFTDRPIDIGLDGRVRAAPLGPSLRDGFDRALRQRHW